MRPLLQLILVLLLSASTFAQNTQVANATNTVFDNLELNRVPYGILLDYGYDFTDVTDITEFDGVLRSDNYLSAKHYRDIYNTLLSARTTTTVPASSPLTTENFKNQHSTFSNQQSSFF